MLASFVSETIIQGLINTILIVICSSVIPFITGLIFNLIASKSSVANNIFSWLSLPLEIICPVIFLIIIYYTIPSGDISTVFIASAVFSIIFAGYMPARFSPSFSFGKNILYNGLGLVSSIFKWSFCVGYIGCMDLLKATQMIFARTYDYRYIWIPLVFVTGVLLVIEVGRRLVKQFMK